jgi:integrase
VLAGECPEDKKKLRLPYQAALEFLFDLAIESAMRMAEMYTLSHDQVDIKGRTIFLDKTKNGDKRQVPMTSVAIAAYKQYVKHVKDGGRGMEGAADEMPKGQVFPFWDGDFSEDSLNRATAKVSAQFGRIFDAAGCPDFVFHDLRHEATSRLFERTNLSDVEIGKITGHKSVAMLMRYANLRGSLLATRLW